MKKLLLLILFLSSLPILTFAQISAITNTGDEVILYENGTWKYTKKSDDKPVEIKTNPKGFTKLPQAFFLLKSTKNAFGIYLSTKDWKFKKATNNDSAEFEFYKNNDEIYSMMINESIEIPLETLKGIVLKNAENVAKDVTIEKEEYRIVNSNKVLCLQFSAIVSGVKLKYLGYYFSNSTGTTQLFTYCGQNFFSKKEKDMEDFLNGFVVTDK